MVESIGSSVLLQKLGVISTQRPSVMVYRCLLFPPSAASTGKPRLFVESLKPAQPSKKFLLYVLPLALASTTRGALSTYRLQIVVRLKSRSTKRRRSLGLMRALLNLATRSLIPVAIIVVTNMSLGTGVLTPNPPFFAARCATKLCSAEEFKQGYT